MPDRRIVLQHFRGSTIWCESPTVRIVWITLQLIADRKREIHNYNIFTLARAANISHKDCEDAISRLISMNPNEGAVAPLEGDCGWRLLSADKYL